MADQTVTVKSTGGTYPTLNAALSGEDGATFDAFTGVLHIVCYNFADSTYWITGTGFASVSSTHYVSIEAYDSHGGKYSTSAYRCEGNMQGNAQAYIQASYTRLTGIQHYNNYAAAGHGLQIADGLSSVILDKCIIKSTSAWALRHWNYTATGCSYRNSVFYVTSGNTYAIDGLASYEILNCVIISGPDGGNGFVLSSGTPVIKNCYCHAPNGTAYVGGTITTSASSDGSQSTATVAYSTSSGAYFTNITSGSEDFHIGASSSLINAGTDLSATFTTDIDGTTRPTGAGTWDIGADEYVAAGGNKATKFAKPAAIMRGMMNHMWHEVTWLKPIGGV